MTESLPKVTLWTEDSSPCCVERSQSIEEAQASICAFVHSKGWRAEVQIFPGVSFVTARCRLFDNEDNQLSVGNGKGDRASAIVGAMFEAVEHYYVDPMRICGPMFLLEAAQFLSAPGVVDTPFFECCSGQERNAMVCRRSKYFDYSEYRYVPLALTAPAYPFGSGVLAGDTFDYAALSKYSSNSGTAIGATFTDATIHAMGELIERDAFSLFLIGHFFGDEPAGYNMERSSLPKAVETWMSSAEAQLEKEILLIDISSDIGVPAFFATVMEWDEEKVLVPFGAGCSLYPEYAAFRAISEVIQGIECRAAEPPEMLFVREKRAAHNSRDYPRMRACVSCHVDRNKLIPGPWKHPAQPKLTAPEALSALLQRFKKASIDISYTINLQKEGAVVVSCFSLALERFFIARHGEPVMPGYRGKALLPRRGNLPNIKV